MKLYFFSFILIFSNSVFAYRNLYRPFAEQMPVKTLKADITGKYFKSLGRVDTQGNTVDYGLDEAFQYGASAFNVNYNLIKKIEFYMGGDYIYNSYTKNLDTYTSSGLRSALLGMTYFFDSKSDLNLALSGQFRKKMFDNLSLTSESILLGDAYDETEFILKASYKLSKAFILSSSVSYRQFSDVQSYEVPYKIELGYRLKSFAFYAGVDGIYSMANDAYSDNPSTKPIFGRGNVTNLYNSINREYLKTYGGIAISIGRSMNIHGHIGQLIMGKSTDTGIEGSIGVSFAFIGQEDKGKIKESQFKEYEIEGEVIKISPRKKFVKVNIGLSDDLDSGMRVDIYKTNYFGSNILVASGVVQELRASWAIIKLRKKYKNIEIKEGFAARAY